VAKTLEITVVGMQHRLAPGTLGFLSQATPLKCELVREPNNPHDANAIKVVVTERPWAKMHDGLHVGYIARQTAAEFAPVMDAGRFPFNDVWLMSVNPEMGAGNLLLRKSVKAKSK
jgi:HIRAN domain